MTRRFVSIFLPTWPTDRWQRRNRRIEGPLALTASGQGGLRLTAVNAAAADEGLTPGMTLADARALVPDLVAAPAEPVADAEALDQLVLWCSRYTPWPAMDGADGFLLDITGCAHLFGGEPGLLADVVTRLERAGIAVRPAIADTPAAAWAWARFRPLHTSMPILGVGAARSRLAPLPVAALRLPPDTAAALSRVGLRTIADVLKVPRAPLVARYGEGVARRLDQLLGLKSEPITPRQAPRLWFARAPFVEPISRREDLEAATERLLAQVCAQLRGAGRGARRLELVFYRVDATAQRLAIGTSRPSHDAVHLLRLFREKLDSVAPGFGIEAMALEAVATDALSTAQAGFDDPADGTDFAQLIDRLRSRLGEHVADLVAQDTHVPERASVRRPFGDRRSVDDTPMPATPRPITLFDRPEAIEAEPLLPGGPPARFRWRGRPYVVGMLEGPERIKPEWWRQATNARERDYYRIESLDGRRFWIFQDGDARWYVHGLFA